MQRRIVVRVKPEREDDEHRLQSGSTSYNLIGSTSAPTRTRASTRSRIVQARAIAWPGGPGHRRWPERRNGASWPWDGTFSSRSCPGSGYNFRGLDPHLREGGARTTSSPRSTSRNSRSMARDTKLWQGGDHARHPQRRGGGPPAPGRDRHRPHRGGSGTAGHPGRQGHAEGGDAVHAGGEAPARRVRREGRGRARYLAPGAAGRVRHGGRCADLFPPRTGKGRPGDFAGTRGDRASDQGPRRRARDHRGQYLRSFAHPAGGADGDRRAGHRSACRGRPGRPIAGALVALPAR